MHGRHPPPEPAQPASRRVQRLLVAIETEHGELRTAFEERLGVAAAAECGVEQRAGGNRGEHVDDLVDHHRLVGEVRRCHGIAAISALVRSATSR